MSFIWFEQVHLQGEGGKGIWWFTAGDDHLQAKGGVQLKHPIASWWIRDFVKIKASWHTINFAVAGRYVFDNMCMHVHLVAHTCTRLHNVHAFPCSLTHLHARYVHAFTRSCTHLHIFAWTCTHLHVLARTCMHLHAVFVGPCGRDKFWTWDRNYWKVSPCWRPWLKGFAVVGKCWITIKVIR